MEKISGTSVKCIDCGTWLESGPGLCRQCRDTRTRVMEQKLVVGVRIKLGEQYCDCYHVPEKTGLVIELVQGEFDHDNGLYTETQTAPSIPDGDGEFDSIYHLFENDLSGFLDCEIIKPTDPNQQSIPVQDQ